MIKGRTSNSLCPIFQILQEFLMIEYRSNKWPVFIVFFTDKEKHKVTGMSKWEKISTS